jgi:signal transduction histidine kinase/BarA-like signal transduction histidine kinase
MDTSRILIVEDESIVALDLQARLFRLGYDVVGIADTGALALDLAEQFRPDLTLMDIRLRSGMDGIETASHLRARFGIPVVYLTAYSDEATLQRAKFTEPLGYLVKPFEERELHSTIEMALYKIAMEKRLQAETSRLQSVVSTLPEGVLLLGKDRRLLMGNQRALDYLRYLAQVDEDETVLWTHPYALDSLLASAGDGGWHELHVTGDKDLIFEINVAEVQTTADKTASEWMLIIRDVTAERELQERIRLQERLAAIGQFAAGIAHDFNNILATVTLELYIVRKTEPALLPKTQERLEIISQQAVRASSLVKQLLDFSRTSITETHDFDLIPLMQELLTMFTRLLPENIRLRLSLPDRPVIINGDPTRITQLLMNLALNARDAMPDGGDLSIEVVTAPHTALDASLIADFHDWTQIRVTDTGCGIEPDDLPHIFEPFFTTKSPGKGTGLGLAQVYGIVQQHGGLIDVSSHIGEGSTFNIWLPMLEAARPDMQKPPSREQTLPNLGDQQTILLVEDNAGVRQAVLSVLEMSNYRVVTAVNGREALALLNKSPDAFALILSDLDMPEMGGLELSRAVRRTGNPVKMLVLTGYAADETLDELKALGVVECLTKPIQIDQLLSAVKNALYGKPA